MNVGEAKRSLHINFTEHYQQMFLAAKKRLGLEEGQNYTVAHWRRKDQLTIRCVNNNQDSGINCGSVDELIWAVKKASNYTSIYIATNEEREEQLLELSKSGFLLFRNTNMLSSSNSDTSTSSAFVNSVDIFVIELQLMIDASQYLHWGHSEVNVLVNTARKQRGKAFSMKGTSSVCPKDICV